MITDRIGRRWRRSLISSREVEAHASLHSKREGVFPLYLDLCLKREDGG
jgi:hypothetical protein